MRQLILLGSGKWQKRIIHTLLDAHQPLNTRQLRIRCGMVTENAQGSLMRNTLMQMVNRGLLRRIARGLYDLPAHLF